MVVMPVSGYLGSSFNRYGTRFWGIPLPKWGWDDHGLRELFFGIREVTAYLLIALIVLHVAGAIKHQWIDRDNLLARMLPLTRARTTGTLRTRDAHRVSFTVAGADDGVPVVVLHGGLCSGSQPDATRLFDLTRFRSC